MVLFRLGVPTLVFCKTSVTSKSLILWHLERATRIELAFFDAPRQQIRSGRGKDGCKQPKTKAYVCENMCDFFFFSWERAI